MSKQPYIYTLPEQFMKDTAVPMHWKLYALINGFWIAGKHVFASNAFFAEKLGCSERYVRECLKKLEEIGVVIREGQSQNRRIVPAARVEEGGTSSSSQGGTDSSVREEPAVPHNSVSNSVRERTAKAVPSFEVVKDSPKPKTTMPRDRAATRLQERLYDMFEEEYGSRPIKTFADYLRVLSALKVMSEDDIIDLVEDALSDGKKKTVREMLTNRALDIYRQENS